MVLDYTVIIAAISQMDTIYQYQPYKTKHTSRPLKKCLAYNVTKRQMKITGC